MGITRNGLMAPPRRLAPQTTLEARARWAFGNQREIVDDALGYAPASPIPKRKRVRSNTEKFETAPVAAVKKLHQRTIRLSVEREPYRSPMAPVGISKRAYEIVKAPTTQPHMVGVSPNSCCIKGPATEMQTRSIYVMTERKNSRTKTQ